MRDKPDYEQLLGNLLARIHGDGGHYEEEHGTVKATEDAEAKVIRWMAGHDVLVKYSRADGLREWVTLGSVWLYPGDSIVVVSGK